MLSINDMLARFATALVLGAILGMERELVHKEAGIRTEMLVSGGAALFAIIGIILPYLVTMPIGATPTAIELTNSFAVIANIIVGIGFLGAGLIVKNNDNHPHGLTTAALVWTTAAIGILSGLGLYQFAVTVTLIIAVVLYLTRRLNIAKELEQEAGSLG